MDNHYQPLCVSLGEGCLEGLEVQAGERRIWRWSAGGREF